MSYLQSYTRYKDHHRTGGEIAEEKSQTGRKPLPPDFAEHIDGAQARFTRLKLTTASAQSVINSCGDSLQALDLSHNRIDSLPSTVPSKLIALNLSKNHISELSSPKALFQLVELNLSRNRIRRSLGLALLVQLQYLDLSHNLLVHIEGLEQMKDLRLLKINGNMLSHLTDLRPLSCNVSLAELYIHDNPLSEGPANNNSTTLNTSSLSYAHAQDNNFTPLS
eukprot:gene46267-56647_t